MVYKTSGVCSSAISFEIDDQGKVHDVKFQGGCSGNTQGVARLVEGMDAKEAISRMEGIRCGFKPTSCPDLTGRFFIFNQRNGSLFILFIYNFCYNSRI